MPIVRLALLGDVVGKPGRHAVRHAVPILREQHGADIVIVNGENARHGRGLHPIGLEEILAAGADAITLGDHYFDDVRITDPLRDPAVPVAAPINTEEPEDALRWTFIRGQTQEPIVVLSVLGRLFMSREHPEPFSAIDAALTAALTEEPDALAVVEMHCEATSEKAACAYHCLWQWPDTVVCVTGTHTHVQTADARLIEGRLAAITDLGMCGAHAGVIGFDATSSTKRIIEQRPSRLVPASGEIAATGMLVDIDTSLRRAVRASTVRVDAPPMDEA